MTEQTKSELIKAFAYGATPESLNEVLTIQEAETFQKEHAAEIEAKKKELEEGGWK